MDKLDNSPYNLLGVSQRLLEKSKLVSSFLTVEILMRNICSASFNIKDSSTGHVCSQNDVRIVVDKRDRSIRGFNLF